MTRHFASGRIHHLVVFCAVALNAAACSKPSLPRVSFQQAVPQVVAYDIVEISATVGWPRAKNPFVDAHLAGTFETADGRSSWQIDGFCDSSDGSVFRIRFAPPTPGLYRYSVEYRQGRAKSTSQGTFRVVDGGKRGPIRVDPRYPWHFMWEGTGDHYFFNGTTAYWLFGWTDDSVIFASLERLHRLSVNRVRVTIAGRTNRFFGEPVIADKGWTSYLTAWIAQNPEDIYHPGFDFTRFSVPYWQKIDRALRFARDRDMIISLVLDMNDHPAHPAAGSDDERRFLKYAVARFGAFTNITWDLGDDLEGYRTNDWAESTGKLIERWDPQRHLATTHPRPRVTETQPRTSSWVGFTSFQNWSRTQHTFMLHQRDVQRSLRRIIPQTNEEYGYEDHYPWWAPPPDQESADALRRVAWDIYMAGGYQTTGETARRGTNVWPNTGGGWMNGRGDSTMTMLEGYARIVAFFKSFEWWKADPHDELASAGVYCLAEPGVAYALYFPHARSATVHLSQGRYKARWFNPIDGAWIDLPDANGGRWVSPEVPDASHDWALLLRRIPNG